MERCTCCFCGAEVGDMTIEESARLETGDRVMFLDGGRRAHKRCYDADIAGRRARVRATVEGAEYQRGVAEAWDGMEVWAPKEIC